MQHVDEGTIHAWIDGALPPDESRQVEEHVASCDACGAAVAEARGLIAASSRILTGLDEVPVGVIPGAMGSDQLGMLRVRRAAERAALARRRWRRAQFVAAAGVVFVAVGTVAVMRRSDVSLLDRALDQVPSLAPAPLSAPPAATPTDSTAAVSAAEARPELKSANAPAPRRSDARAVEAKETAAASGSTAAGMRLADSVAAPPLAAPGRAEAASRDQIARQGVEQQAASQQQAKFRLGQQSQLGAPQQKALDSMQRVIAPPLLPVTVSSAARLTARREAAPDAAVMLHGCYRLNEGEQDFAMSLVPAVFMLDSAVARLEADTLWYRAEAIRPAAPPGEVELTWRALDAGRVVLRSRRANDVMTATIALTDVPRDERAELPRESAAAVRRATRVACDR